MPNTNTNAIKTSNKNNIKIVIHDRKKTRTRKRKPVKQKKHDSPSNPHTSINTISIPQYIPPPQNNYPLLTYPQQPPNRSGVQQNYADMAYNYLGGNRQQTQPQPQYYNNMDYNYFVDEPSSSITTNSLNNRAINDNNLTDNQVGNRDNNDLSSQAVNYSNAYTLPYLNNVNDDISDISTYTSYSYPLKLTYKPRPEDSEHQPEILKEDNPKSILEADNNAVSSQSSEIVGALVYPESKAEDENVKQNKKNPEKAREVRKQNILQKNPNYYEEKQQKEDFNNKKKICYQKFMNLMSKSVQIILMLV